MANGAKNVIIQNIHITELNPQYIWGGDAITVDGSDLIWVGTSSQPSLHLLKS
jgi:pectin lyase